MIEIIEYFKFLKFLIKKTFLIEKLIHYLIKIECVKNVFIEKLSILLQFFDSFYLFSEL